MKYFVIETDLPIDALKDVLRCKTIFEISEEDVQDIINKNGVIS